MFWSDLETFARRRRKFLMFLNTEITFSFEIDHIFFQKLDKFEQISPQNLANFSERRQNLAKLAKILGQILAKKTLQWAEYDDKTGY